MAKKPTKAANNVFCIKRIEAAMCNEMLSSREGASEVTGIDRTRIARIELGSLTPYPEEVQLLADAYNAPELLNYHCAKQCPIGKCTVVQIKMKEIHQISVQLYNAVKDLPLAVDELFDIAEDGQVTHCEQPRLREVISKLDRITHQANALKLWARKHLKDEG